MFEEKPQRISNSLSGIPIPILPINSSNWQKKSNMEYRKNPLTGDWVLIGGSHDSKSKQTTSFYTSRTYFNKHIKIEDDWNPSLIDMEPHELYTFFQYVRKWGTDIGNDIPKVAVQCFLKPHATAKGEPQAMQMYVVPDEYDFLDKSIRTAKTFFETNKTCLLCAMNRQENDMRERIITHSKQYIAYEPFFSRLPYETFIVPYEHQSEFYRIDDASLKELSIICHDIFHRIYTATKGADFSLFLHHIHVPFEYHPYTHWYIQILPWRTHWAGFEIATAMHINITTPEECAKYLSDEKKA